MSQIPDHSTLTRDMRAPPRHKRLERPVAAKRQSLKADRRPWLRPDNEAIWEGADDED